MRWGGADVPSFALMRRTALILALCAFGCRTQTEPPVSSGGSNGVAQDIPAEVADEVLASMDRTTAACDDFYRFACGEWIDSTELPADEPRFGRFNVLRERNVAALRDILETQQAAGTKTMLGKFYGACVDEQRVDERGAKPLAQHLAAIDAVEDIPGMLALAGAMHARGAGILFDLDVGPDYKDPTLNVAHLSQGGLGLPDRDYYLKEGEAEEAKRKAYVAHIAEVLTASGLDGAVAAEIMAFEKKIAEVSKRRDEMRDPDKQYNRVTPAELAALTPKLPWSEFFGGLGRPGLDQLNVAPPEFFQGLDRVVSETPIATLKAYARWQLIHRFAPDLHGTVANSNYVFFKQLLRGQKSPTPRWKHCVQTTDRALGELLGKAYVDLHFAGDSRGIALDMINQIEAAFARGLPELEWMDGSTRERAVQKMEAIVNKIGYPDSWRDYGGVAVAGEHFENVAAAKAFEAQRKLAEIGRPVDKAEWHMSPPTVNAYYNPPNNEMVFPAGILQPPFFSPEYPMAMNFGGIGMVMGHELTHGFDDQGRKFDGEGRLRQWWEEGAVQRFEERAACVEGLYDGYEVQPGLTLNGKLTLGENIADFGGIKQSHRAYMAWAETTGEDPKSNAIDGLTREQLFFVSYGQIWCSKATPEVERVLAVTDPHSHPRYRVNGPLSNLPAFHEAFGCEPGAPMRPQSSCEVW